ncbi:Thioredoxin domain [Arabidopsis thaliana x Arabidopsis arenosa]|uniref:Thioredoxin domain n=1 Tax=Arabidopsis thaliana x Arabidopsis arenosa TaxID=1240361 RepID=A0A8T2CHX7_9BRAS|nr:Thioredoxin domain [Arabidopsis thaliana x Arabidopsis arenosa]
MVSTTKIKSVDFYRKIPRDLTEASLSGAGLSIVAALAMLFLFGMELSSYLAINTSTSVIVDKSSDGDFLDIDFNISFPALSCEFASVDVSDVFGTHRLNITKTIRKVPIDPHLRATAAEFHSSSGVHLINHGDEDHGDNSTYADIPLTGAAFEKFTHHFQVLVVNFYAPWCYWSNRLKPSWEKASQITRERYNPGTDDRVLLGSVDCTEEPTLCKSNHIQGYPSIRIFRRGSDLREDHGNHEHESYYGDRDTDSLVKMVEELPKPIKKEDHKLALDGKSDNAASTIKKAPVSGGCRIEGYVRAKKVPGELVISAHSGAHSFDASQMNMSHIVTHLSFGTMVSERLWTDMKRLLPYLGQSHDRLNGKSFINQRKFDVNVTIEHYLQIVKTEVTSRRSGKEHSLIEEYEYTAHSSVAHSYRYPEAKFHFELSPMQVLISENPKSFSHFITNVCAIIGGVFTVAGILDSIFQNTVRMVKKIELGKNI